MDRSDWDETARGFADYIGQYRFLVERGAVPLQIDPGPAGREEEYPLVVGVFGNDNENLPASDLEVEGLRRRLEEGDWQELGFAQSADGSTWALLVGADNSFQTAVARTFQREMMKSLLNEAVWQAWSKVSP